MSKGQIKKAKARAKAAREAAGDCMLGILRSAAHVPEALQAVPVRHDSLKDRSSMTAQMAARR
jgi:hypothetical protein